MVLSSNTAAGEVLAHLNFTKVNFSFLAEKNTRIPLIYLILAFLNTQDNSISKKFVSYLGKFKLLVFNFILVYILLKKIFTFKRQFLCN